MKDLANQIYGANQQAVMMEPKEGPTNEETGEVAEVIESDVQELSETNPEPIEQEGDEVEPEQANHAEPRIVKMDIEGKEVEIQVLSEDIDPDLVPKAGMMEKSFRQKTMKLADERRAVEEQSKKIDEALIELNDQILFEKQQLESTQMQELKDFDSDEYERIRLAVEKKASLFNRYKAERDDELQKQHAEFFKKDREMITDFIPEWQSEKAVQQDMKKIETYLADKYGFDEKQVEQISENSYSNYLAILRDAALLYEIQNTPLESKKARKVSKTSRPNAATANEAPKREKTYAEILYGSN